MPLSVEQFVENLTRSGLLSATEIAAFRACLGAGQAEDGETLARELIRAQKLTKYQASAVYQGKIKGLAFGEYVVLDKLGEGGMGVVFKAQHRRMKRLVAIKTLPAGKMRSAETIKRFHLEVEAAARLTHPNIVAAYDAGVDEGRHYLVMEYVDGEDLASLVKRLGPLPVEKAVEYILQAARGLQYAHAEGVIHRDIKPGNLLLDKRGTAKILDMGLAHISTGLGPDNAERLTQSGQVMGTCDYMAPEQALDTRRVDQRSDIYSLGCTFYRLLSGKTPYQGDLAIQVLLAHREHPIPSLQKVRPDVPAEVDAVCQKMMAKQPEDRPQSMAEVIAALEACRTVPGAPAAKRPRPSRPARRRNRRLWAAVVAGLGVLVGVGLFLLPGGREDAKQETALTAVQESPHVETSVADKPVPRSAGAASQTLQLKTTVGVFPRGAPLSRLALVNKPAPVAGSLSWTVDTVSCRGGVGAVAYSPDGKVLATVSQDGAVRLWDPSDGRLLRVFLGHERIPNSVGWSPDGRYLATASEVSGVHVREVASGLLVRRYPGCEPLGGNVQWSPTGRHLAFVDNAPRLLIWDLAAEEIPSRAAEHGSPIGSLSWAPDGTRLASAGTNGRAKIWDATTMALEREIRVADNRSTSVAWSPEGTLLATTNQAQPNTVQLWDATNGTQVGLLTNSASEWEETSHAVWSPDGRLLAVFGRAPKDNLCVWEVASKTLHRSFTAFYEPACRPCWSPNGKSLAIGALGRSLVLLCNLDDQSVKPLRMPYRRTGGTACVRFSCDGRQLAFGDPDGSMGIWPFSSGELPQVLHSAREQRVTTVAWSQDDRRLLELCPKGPLTIWDVSNAQPLQRIAVEGSDGMAAIAPDGSWAVTSGRHLDIWDLASGKRRHTLTIQGSWPAISPDGQWLAVCLRSNKVLLVDPESGQRLKELPVPKPPTYLAWSSDSSRLITDGMESDSDLLIWDVAGEKILHRLSQKTHGSAKASRWLNDNKTLVVRNGCMHSVIWDLESGKKLAEPFFCCDGVHSDVSPDGRLIATRTDSMIRLDNATRPGAKLTLVFLPAGFLVVDESGQYRVSSGSETEVIYAVQSDHRQETLTPEEFARRYGWKNDPTQVRGL